MPLLLIAAALVVFIAQTVRLALFKQFTIDEFQYAHSAWLLAQGQLPYVDFFEVHHPLLYQLMSPIFAVGGDDPSLIWWMRLGMLPFVAMTAVCAWAINRSRGRVTALLGPVLLLSVLTFAERATEIRNDSVALAFFAGALAVLYARHWRVSLRAFLSGALLVSAVWSSQKVYYYGLVFVAALLVDLSRGRRRDDRLLGDPRWFLVGAGVVAAPIALYLTTTGSWGEWWRWCYVWVLHDQTAYEPVSWGAQMAPVLVSWWWGFALAAFGVVITVRDLKRRRDAAGHPDYLLLAALGSTFVSITAQVAPFPYAFLPFLAVVAIFAGRGAAALCLPRLPRTGKALDTRFSATVGALLLGLLLYRANVAIEARLQHDNGYQYQVLQSISELTDPGDHAYDNSGGFVTRPHTHYFFYSDKVIRSDEAERLATEVPERVMELGTVLFLHDRRFEGLPEELQAFFVRNYQRYSGDVWLWGRRYDQERSADVNEGFDAVIDGDYFVEPADVLDAGRLTVDGELVTDSVFHLEAGHHELRYDGPTTGFWVLWLPRNGRTYTPEPDARPHFSVFL